MSSKISQLNELLVLNGDEQGLVSFNGGNYRFALKKLAALVTKEDLGLDKVDNTSDLEKPISQTTQAALDGKANTQHGHAISEVNGLSTALDGKAAIQHNHAITEVTGLQDALDGKANTAHGHQIGDVTGLQNALDGKSNTGHGHSMSDVNGLNSALANINTSLQQKAPLTHHHGTNEVDGLSAYVDQKIADAVGFAEVVFQNPEW